MRKAGIIAFILLVPLASGLQALNTYDSLDGEAFDPVNPVQVNLTGEFNSSVGLDSAFLATNETRDFKNRTSQYGIIDLGNVSNQRVNATFNWTNANNLVQDRTVGWRVWANNTNGEWVSTSIATFKIIERPVIEYVRAEDVSYQETTQIKAKVVDIVGPDDVENVTFKVNAPDGRTYEVSARKGQKVNGSDNRLSGYIWTSNFSQTSAEGIHTVKAVASEEIHKTSAQGRFEVTAPIFPTVAGFNLNPFFLGGNTVVEGAGEIVKENLAYVLVGGLLLVSGIVVLFSTLGGGVEENEWELPEPLEEDQSF